MEYPIVFYETINALFHPELRVSFNAASYVDSKLVNNFIKPFMQEMRLKQDIGKHNVREYVLEKFPERIADLAIENATHQIQIKTTANGYHMYVFESIFTQFTPDGFIAFIAVIEYLVSELLEQAGDVCKFMNEVYMNQNHVKDAIENDNDLITMFN